MAVRLSLLSAARLVGRLHDHPDGAAAQLRPAQPGARAEGTLFQRSFGQLFTTLKEMRGFPMTLTFLIAYLFYNDGIQTVIYAASTYGSKQLKFDESVLIATILLIQFVAFGGALFFGRLAAKYGAYRSILWGLYAWMVIVVLALFLPGEERRAVPGRRGRHRHRAGRHPGAVAVVLQPAHPPRPRGRVLRPLQRLPSAARRGSARCCSAWSSRSPAPTGRRSSR